MSAEVKVYTTTYCGYCHAAKNLFKRKKVAFEEVDVTGNDEARHWLAEVTGKHTVPQIFINGAPVGGFDDVSLLDRQGKLDPLLAVDAPAR
jgi:glutaredoxin 3